MTAVLPDIKVDRTESIVRMRDEDILSYDIIQLHGRVDLPTLQVLERLKKKFVYDVDDYWHCTPDRLFYNEWKHYDQKGIVEQCIKAASAVTCTSDILAHYIKKHTGVIATVLPNGIADKDPQFISTKTESTRLRFGFVGGSSHVLDIPIISKAFMRVYNQYPEYRQYWQIVFGGFDIANAKQLNAATGVISNIKQKDSPSVQIEKMLTDNYAICDPIHAAQLKQYTTDPTDAHDQYRRIGTMDVQNYGKILRYINIGLAPLQDNTFNRCKSNLKIIEYGWMGCEVIASYLGTFFDGKLEGSISFCSTTDEWVRAIVFQIENFIEKHEPIKSSLQELVHEHYNAKNFAQKRYELYKSIL